MAIDKPGAPRGLVHRLVVSLTLFDFVIAEAYGMLLRQGTIGTSRVASPASPHRQSLGF
jgi:hypothetical protein